MKNLFTLIAALLVTGTAVQLSAQDIAEGLVVHYKFEDNLVEEVTGQVAETQGTFSYAPGRDGQAIRFAFEENYFLTPMGAVVPGNTPVSFAMMVNHDPTIINTRRQNYLQQLNGDGETGRATLYLQRPDSPTNPDSIISFVSNRTSKSNYKLTTGGQWFHLALTIDPVSSEFVFYVNGEITNRDTTNKVIEPSTGSYIVGHHKGLTTNTITFAGLMDELRMYDRILTPEEVQLLAAPITSTREAVVDASFNISPNPAGAGQLLTLDLDRSAFSIGSAIELQVYDANGRSVISRQLEPAGNKVTLDNNLAPGMYTATLSDGSRLASTRFSIQD